MPGRDSRAARILGAGLLALGLLCAPAHAQTADRLQQLQDRAEIEELITRYATALDTLDADAYANVFTEDAEFDVTGTLYKGRAAIRSIVTNLQESRARSEASGTPPPALYHVMSNTSIEILSAEEARHSSYAQTVRADEDGRFVVGFMGRYDDVIVKRDGRWQIRSRTLESFVR